ncbi:MAG: serine/threonine-protein kinase, partial [Myxococcota bacterium]|nr:serine/threonine-protein kinase [Myxococcota bacterium]
MSDKMITIHGVSKTHLLKTDLPPDQTITLFGGGWSDDESIATEIDMDVIRTTIDQTSSLEVIGLLGEGGMGRVLRGQQALPRREVAIKTPKTSEDISFYYALLHEAKIMGALEHPNIVPVHQVIVTKDQELKVVMKKIQGESLSHVLLRGAMRGDILRKGIGTLIQVCNALEFAHDKGIIHRDVKPENIMLGSFGEVYLLDWGTALNMNETKESPKGVLGTPSYMAPEMLFGDPLLIDVQSDVYLLGATLHEMLTGTKRHEGSSMSSVLLSIDRSEPYEFDDAVPQVLASLVNRSCAKHMSERPSCVQDFRIVLETYLEQWDGYLLSEAASEKLHVLRDMVQKGRVEGEDYILLCRNFYEARFGLEQSLRIVPNYQPSLDALQEAILIMIDVLLEKENTNFAIPLIDSLPVPQPELKEKALQIRHEQERLAADAQKLKKIAQEYDRSTSKKERLILVSTMAFICIFMVSGAGIYDYIYDPIITPQRLLFTMGMIALFTNSAIFMGRKQLLSNAVGRRSAIALGVGSTGFVLVGLGGLIHHASADMMMLMYLLCVFLTFAMVHPAIRNASQIA